MNKIIYIKLFVIILMVLSCSNKQNDQEQIISLVFNSQIGNQEYFGQVPPVPPLPPNFEDLQKHKSIEVARQNLKTDEWKNYFEEERRYDSRVVEWKMRMKSLDRKILLYNDINLSQYIIEKIAKFSNEYGIDIDFLTTTRKWDRSDIQNESEYEILNYSEFDEQKLDSLHVGRMGFSEVGFNKEMDKAILYFNWNCEHLCEGGNLVILKKENNIWEIKEILDLW